MADVSYFGDTGARWSALQLWQAMKMIVAAPGGTVPYWTLRDTVFGGNDDVILSLIKSKLTVFVKLVHLSLYALHSIAFNTLHSTTLCILHTVSDTHCSPHATPDILYAFSSFARTQ